MANNISDQAKRDREARRRGNGRFGQRISSESGAQLLSQDAPHFHPAGGEPRESRRQTVERFDKLLTPLFMHHNDKKTAVRDFEETERLAQLVQRSGHSQKNRRQIKQSMKTSRRWAKDFEQATREDIREAQTQLKRFEKRGVTSVGGIGGNVQDRMKARIEKLQNGESPTAKLALAFRENEHTLRFGLHSLR